MTAPTNDELAVRLPDRVTYEVTGEAFPKCPWCGSNMEDAPVRLSDVFWDFFDGHAYMQAPVDCPECGKPSKYSARRLPQNYIDHHELRGVRTEADKAFARSLQGSKP